MLFQLLSEQLGQLSSLRYMFQSRMSDSQWLWHHLFVCQTGPLRVEKTCAALPRKEIPGNLGAKREIPKKRSTQVEQPCGEPVRSFNSRLSAERYCVFFLCKKWHSGRQQNLRIPLGGAKQSGIGRELGEAGLSAYSNVKAIHVNMQSKL